MLSAEATRVFATAVRISVRAVTAAVMRSRCADSGSGEIGVRGSTPNTSNIGTRPRGPAVWFIAATAKDKAPGSRTSGCSLRTRR